MPKATLKDLRDRMNQGAQELREVPKPKPTPQTTKPATLIANPPRRRGIPGEANPGRSDYRKVTITLSPELIEALAVTGSRRKARGEKGHAISEMVREALVDWLRKQDGLRP